MAHDLTNKPKHLALSAELAQQLMTGIAESRATTVIAGGKPLLRLLKTGEWVVGQTDEPVQDGSAWAVNVMSLQHGWVCWSQNPDPNQVNEMLGEVLAPMFHTKPPRPDDIQGYPYKEERTFEARCLDGDLADMEVLYKVNSLSGMRNIDDLLAAIQKQLAADPAHPCPVIQLRKDSYQHKKHGKIVTPEFVIVDWVDMEGRNGKAASRIAKPMQPAPAGADEGLATTAAQVDRAVRQNQAQQAEAYRGTPRRRPATR